MSVLLHQRYEITTRLGGGGMGVVYQAADTKLGRRPVAVKEMRQDNLKPDEIVPASKAFKQEAFLLASLMHQNLPRILDHFQENNNWYLVMDFIEGKTLADYQKAQGGKLPLGEVLNIGIQLCTVLDYLHTRQQPIIFRDLKPSNIMRALDGHIYLIDFGIARHFKSTQAQDTNAAWSVGYSPPEQSPTLYYKQTTPQSDIYSLGAMLHHLLTGNKPWENKPSVFDFPPLSSFDPSLPSALQTLIMQMVNKDVNNRPASATNIKNVLQDIADQKITNPLLSGNSQTFISPHRPSLAITRTIPAQPVAPETYKQPIMNPALPLHTPPIYTRTAPSTGTPSFAAFSPISQPGSAIRKRARSWGGFSIAFIVLGFAGGLWLLGIFFISLSLPLNAQKVLTLIGVAVGVVFCFGVASSIIFFRKRLPIIIGALIAGLFFFPGFAVAVVGFFSTNLHLFPAGIANTFLGLTIFFIVHTLSTRVSRAEYIIAICIEVIAIICGCSFIFLGGSGNNALINPASGGSATGAIVLVIGIIGLVLMITKEKADKIR